jgi:hypothetical protein
MKAYQVECRAIITLAAADMQEAVSRSAAVIKDNPHLILVKAVHEISVEPIWKDLSQKISQRGSIGARQSFPLAA